MIKPKNQGQLLPLMFSHGILLLSIGQQTSGIEAILLLCPEPLLSNEQQPSNIEDVLLLCPQTDTQKPFVVPGKDHRICPFKSNYSYVSS